MHFHNLHFATVILLMVMGCHKGGLSTTEPRDTAPSSSSDSGDTASDPDPETVPLNGACDLEDDLGGFMVVAETDYSYVTGTVSNGVVPATILEEIQAEGDCLLMLRDNPYCDPPCDAGETCDFDGSCIPYPETQDLGQVAIVGLEEAVAMDPMEPGFNYFDTDVPHPAFLPGNLVTLRTEGGAYEALELYGVGVDLLEPGEEDLAITEGQALLITWNPPQGTSRSTVRLELTIDQHGNTPISLWCEFQDTGSGEIPADLVTGLVEAGVSGFPNASLNRHTVDSAQVADGCVDFEISSPRFPDVSVSGYTPCYSDKDCPPGESCNELLEICE